MYLNITKTISILLLGLSVVFLSGCTSTKVFQKAMQDQDDKIQKLQSGVEANQSRIEDLEKETKAELTAVDRKADDAVAKGDEAQKLAENLEMRLEKRKLLYQVALTNEAVRFGFNEYDLSEELKAILDDLVKMIKGQNKRVYIDIQGHTDNIGSKEYNMKLGAKRAEAVRRYLNETHMIPLAMMSIISYGESRPVADNSTKDGRSQNRRVVIKVWE